MLFRSGGGGGREGGREREREREVDGGGGRNRPAEYRDVEADAILPQVAFCDVVSQPTSESLTVYEAVYQIPRIHASSLDMLQ